MVAINNHILFSKTKLTLYLSEPKINKLINKKGRNIRRK
jgi:predicted RNA-binding protein YlqC (UPF0109 family)